MITTPHVLTALDRLSGSHDFGVVISWMKAEREDRINKLLLNSNTVSVHQDQGYALALTDILQLATTARESLSSLG
jgi:hypothetical protein